MSQRPQQRRTQHKQPLFSPSQSFRTNDKPAICRLCRSVGLDERRSEIFPKKAIISGGWDSYIRYKKNETSSGTHLRRKKYIVYIINFGTIFENASHPCLIAPLLLWARKRHTTQTSLSPDRTPSHRGLLDGLCNHVDFDALDARWPAASGRIPCVVYDGLWFWVAGGRSITSRPCLRRMNCSWCAALCVYDMMRKFQYYEKCLILTYM